MGGLSACLSQGGLFNVDVRGSKSSSDQKAGSRPKEHLVELPLQVGLSHGAQAVLGNQSFAPGDDLSDCSFCGREAIQGPIPIDRVLQQRAGDEFVQCQRAIPSSNGLSVFGQTPSSIEGASVDDDMLAAQQRVESA